jgi:hypothetical protein
MYFVFMISNFVASGIGAWIALCHAEILRDEMKQKEISGLQNSFTSQEILQNVTSNDTDFSSSDVMASEIQTPVEETLQVNDDSVSEDSGNDLSMASENATETVTSVIPEIGEADSNEVDSKTGIDENEPNPLVSIEPHSTEEKERKVEDEWNDNERLRLDGAERSITKPLFSGEMFEQLVGMIEDDESDELAPIVCQLQEIHDMAVTAGHNCYASEDANFFITPDKEHYATTAICRPMVGRKSDQ